MKRYSGLHDKRCTIEDIEVADDNVRKNKKEFKVRMCAYYGWLKHADAKNLLYKIQSLTGVRYSNWNGKRTNIAKYYGKYVRIIQVINYAKYFRINFIRNGKAYYADIRDKTLFYSIHRLNHFPINFKITKYDWRIYTKNRKENINLKYNILWLKINLKMILLELYAV